nr:uncharacterized protein LOC109187050 [Ipomoea batatas]
MKKKQSLQRIELPNEMKGFNYLQKKWSARRKVHGSRRHSNEACHQDDGGSRLPCASARLGDDCRYSRRWQAVADGSGGAVVGCDRHEVGVGDIMVGDGVLAASVSSALLNRFSRSSKMDCSGAWGISSSEISMNFTPLDTCHSKERYKREGQDSTMQVGPASSLMPRQSSILQSGDHHPQPRMMMFNNIYDNNLLMLRPPSDEQHLIRVGRRECVSCLFNDPSYPSSLTNLSLSLSWPHHHQMMHYLPRQYIYNRAYPPPPPLRMFSGQDEIFAPPGGSWNIYPKFVAKEINLTPQSSGIGLYYNGVPIYEKGEEYCSCDLTLGRGSNGKGKEPINVSSMVGSSNTVVVPPSFFSLQLPSGDGGLGFTDDNINDINNVSGKNKRKRQYTHRKTSVYSFPTNVKNLLSTGIFEGVPVKYVSWSRGAVNAYEFEKHAGCDTKHPNNNIYFPSGKSLYSLVQELKVIPQNDLLFEAIQTASGTPINIKNFKAWKALYESASSSLGPNPMNY